MLNSFPLPAARPLVALALLAMLFAVPRSASLAQVPNGFSQYTAEHEFQLLIPAGWTVHLDAAKEFGEDDLRVLANSPDKQQVIKVYRDEITSARLITAQVLDTHPALISLHMLFSQAASNPRRHGFQVKEAPDTWDVANADDAAFGSYTYTDEDGALQWADVLQAVRGSSIYELDNLPTAAYARSNADQLFQVIDSFQLLR